MSTQKITLNDRFDLDKSPVLLNGTQALVRLMLTQKARDRAAGLNTAGLVTGYRGSPLGAVDMQMTRAAKQLAAHDVREVDSRLLEHRAFAEHSALAAAALGTFPAVAPKRGAPVGLLEHTRD